MVLSVYRQKAKEQLKNANAPKKTILIHACIAQGSALLIALIGYLFHWMIAQTGGLSGVSTRTILSTAQTMLETAVMMALPFWQIGIFYVALRWARGQYANSSDLLQGFRHFRSVLGLQILYTLIFMLLGTGLFYISSTLFLLTPFSQNYMDALSPLMDPAATTEQIEALLSMENLAVLARDMVPLFIIFGIIFLVIGIPLFYRLRLSEFAVMDGLGARKSLRCSLQATKGKWKMLLKLDLFFWWYYLLQGLCFVIANGNWLLPRLGIQLPLGADAAYFLFFSLGTALQILVLWQFQDQVITSYAMLYDTLTQPQTAPVLEQAQ